MPMINGQVVRSRFTSLSLKELSSVDRPAQPGALATILKRHDPAPAQPSILALAVAKYVDSDDGAHTFAEVLTENEFDEKIWPMVSALSQSIRSIMGDKQTPAADRESKVTQSVDEFLAAVRDISPPAEKKLAELISKKEPTMHTIESLTRKVEELTGQLTSANTLAQTEKARADGLQTQFDAEKAAHETAKAALATATEETLKIGDREVKKSEFGAVQFDVLKAQEERAQTAVLEKRAMAEFAHVTGTPTEKAAVLRHIETMPEEAQKAATAILVSAEKMAASGFGRIGLNSGETPTTKAAQATFSEKVNEIRKRDSCSEADAMRKARGEHPDAFAAAYPDTAEAAGLPVN